MNQRQIRKRLVKMTGVWCGDDNCKCCNDIQKEINNLIEDMDA